MPQASRLVVIANNLHGNPLSYVFDGNTTLDDIFAAVDRRNTIGRISRMTVSRDQSVEPDRFGIHELATSEADQESGADVEIGG